MTSPSVSGIINNKWIAVKKRNDNQKTQRNGGESGRDNGVSSVNNDVGA